MNSVWFVDAQTVLHLPLCWIWPVINDTRDFRLLKLNWLNITFGIHFVQSEGCETVLPRKMTASVVLAIAPKFTRATHD